jgi:hypothetical protein
MYMLIWLMEISGPRYFSRSDLRGSRMKCLASFLIICPNLIGYLQDVEVVCYHQVHSQCWTDVGTRDVFQS